MSCQLPVECLNDIFEYLEEDKTTLHSCLLVNRLWCKISVRILWRNIWRFIPNSYLKNSILCTLIACLPNESKEFLYFYSLKVKRPSQELLVALNPPLFNYAAFCKVLSIYHIYYHFDSDKNHLIVKEIIKMFMNQFSFLKKLSYYSRNYISFWDDFQDFPARADLSELCCSSNINSEFFYQLSRICHNLQSLNIEFKDKISHGLKELISLQNNLKNLNLFSYDYEVDWKDIIPAITKHSGTLNKLHIYGSHNNLSFVALFLNLQEIKISFAGPRTESEFFETLQNITFLKLKILKITRFKGSILQRPKLEYMMKFLENNGKNLKELYTNPYDSLDLLPIAKFCPNLRKFSIEFNDDKLDIFKTIFNSCQYLESIKVWCRTSEKELLEVIVNHSPKNFCKLKIFLSKKLFSKNLEIFFINWKNRASKKSITLIISTGHYYYNSKEVKMIIEKYKNLGIIKKFEIKGSVKEAHSRFWIV